MEYEYSRENRLEKPHSYMYTQYGGKEFLRVFFSSRNSIIREVQERLHKSLSDSKVIKDIVETLDDFTKPITPVVLQMFHRYLEEQRTASTGGSRWQEILQRETFKTVDLLHHCIGVLIMQPDKDSDLIAETLNVLTKKYEVMKKVFSQYATGFKSVFTEDKTPAPYLLLSYCLLLYYNKTDNLKFLNCSLKLNDAICSISQELNRPEQLINLLLNLRLEHIAVKRLMSRKDVRI